MTEQPIEVLVDFSDDTTSIENTTTDSENTENGETNYLPFQQKLKVLDGDITIEKIIKKLKNNDFKNVIILCGAGISTSCGIPDFRSKGGLFENKESPQEVFEIEFFKNDPSPFYRLSKKIYPSNFKPSITHKLIKKLSDEKILLKCFTQNIDGLERIAGIPEEKLMESHGTFASCHCINCNSIFPESIYKKAVFNDEKPVCKNCSNGLVKPDITFYGEKLPNLFFENIHLFDQCDLLIVMGTSLKVHPFNALVDRVPLKCPRVLINREKVGTFDDSEENYRDVIVLSDCDSISKKIFDEMNWKIPSESKEPIIIPTPIFKRKRGKFEKYFEKLRKKIKK